MSETQTTLSSDVAGLAAPSAEGADSPTPPATGEDEPFSSPPHAPWRVWVDPHPPLVDPRLADWLASQLHRILPTMTAGPGQPTGGEVTVVVVGDAEMAQLHQRYKGVAGTTDVLTFDLRDPGPDAHADVHAQPLEADIVVCVDQAVRQAARRGHPARVEVLLYAVHGLLHLLGEDDATADTAARMHRREDEILSAAGFGAVFAAPAPGDDESAGNDAPAADDWDDSDDGRGGDGGD